MDRNGLIGFLLILVLCIAVFMICREVMCWYWKVNKRLEIEQQILEELRKLNAKIPQEKSDQTAENN